MSKFALKIFPSPASLEFGKGRNFRFAGRNVSRVARTLGPSIWLVGLPFNFMKVTSLIKEAYYNHTGPVSASGL